MKNIFYNLAAFLLFSGVAYGEKNVAPPVPKDSNAGNGHVIKTEVTIDVDKDTEKIVLKHSSAHPLLVTKAFTLKNGDPYVVRTLISEAIDGVRDKLQIKDTRVETIKYKDLDITGVLVVTASEDRFEEREGRLSIGQLIKKLDQPLMLDIQARYELQMYKAKHQPAHVLKEMLERYILDVEPNFALATADVQDIIDNGGVDGYLDQKQKNNEFENKFGLEFAMIDSEINSLFIGSSTVNVNAIRDFLRDYDKPYANLMVNLTIYEIENKNQLELGNDFNKWKNANDLSLLNYADGGHAVSLKAELNAKYIDFLARKGDAKVYTSMDMILRSEEEGRFEERKLLVRTLKKDAATDGDAHAPDLVVSTDQTATNQYYGTTVVINPQKMGVYTKLVLDADNTSLVGFNDDGSAKTVMSSLDTEVIINNEGARYVAGYFSKREVVHTVEKVPLLGSMPYVGSLFSTESDHTKTSQLVIVVSCRAEEFNQSIAQSERNKIDNVIKKSSDSDKNPKPFYDQSLGH